MPSLPLAPLVGSLVLVGVLLAVVAGALTADAAIGSRPALYVLTLPILGALGLALMVKAPGVLFALYLTVPFYKGVFPSPVDLTLVLAVAVTLSTAPRTLRILANGRDWRLIGLWFAVCATVTAGAVVGGGSQATLNTVVTFVLLVGVAGLSAIPVAREPNLRRQFAWTLFTLGCITTLAGLSSLPQAGSLYRASIFGANPINTARAVLLVLVAGLPLLGGRRALAASPLMAASVVVAFTTASRGPVIFAGVALVVMWIAASAASRHGPRFLVLTGGLLVLVLAPLPRFLTALVPQFALDRMSSVSSGAGALLGGGGDLGKSDATRLDLWALAIDLFEQRPFFGWGAGSFERFTPNIGLPEITYPHNFLLHAAAEFGIVGLIVFGGVMAFAVLRAARQHVDPAATVIATVALFIILGSMVSGSMIEDRMLWGMILMVLALPRVHEDDSGRMLPET
jgi:O-antigen ligase